MSKKLRIVRSVLRRTRSLSSFRGRDRLLRSGTYSTLNAAGTADVRLTDSGGQHADASITIDSALGFAPGATTADGGLTLALSGTGGHGPYTYSVVSGAGTVSASTGLFTTPATAGSTVVQVADANGGTSQISINNYAALGVTPPSLTVTAGAGQTMQFSGTGGSGGYTYTLVSGPGTPSPTGIYTAVNTSGTATVQVTDSLGTSALATVRSLRIRVNGQVLAAVTDGTSWYLGARLRCSQPVFRAGDGDRGCERGQSCSRLRPRIGVSQWRGRRGRQSPTAIYVGGEFFSYRGTLVSGLVKLDPQTCALDTTFSAGGGFSPNGVSSAELCPVARFTSQASSTATAALRHPTWLSWMPRPAPSTRRSRARLASQCPAPTAAHSLGSSSAQQSTRAGDSPPTAARPCLLPRQTRSRHRGLDTTFAAGVKLNGQVNALAASGSALYAAGGFTADGGTPVMLAKLDPATAALDTTFAMNAGFYPGVDAIAESGSSVYIGSQFSSGSYPLLAKLDAATSGVADAVFTQPGSLDFGVTALTVFGTSVYAGGYFTHYLGRNARHFLKVDATTGALDMTFTQPTGANAALSSIAGQGTTIYAAGSLSTYRGQLANSITKINGATDAIDSVFAQSTGATEAGTFAEVNAVALVGSSPLCRGSI